LEKLAKGRPYIATHPVWGPESYKKRKGDVKGFRIVVTEHTLPAREFSAVAALVRRFGFKIVRTTAEEHDKHLAQTLFLTHFLSQTITRAGFDRTEIDTVSFGFLMDAVETVRENKRLFLDVYRYNPHCEKVLERFAGAEERIRRLLISKRHQGPVSNGTRI
jgi:prephenate dehydrogenase